MRKSSIIVLLFAASGFLVLPAVPAAAAEIKLVSSVALKSVLDALLPGFEQTSGHKVTPVFGTAASLKTRIDGGEAFDMVVLSPAQVDDLIKQGKATSRADLAHAGTALAIKAGATRPDLASDEKLKTFLLSVKSITHGDPAQGGFSTVYFLKTATTLGIAETLKSKTKFTPAGQGAVPVAKGESELGVGLMSEIIPVAGVQALPLKPDDPAGSLFFAGALAVQAKDANAARALLTYLQTGTAKETFKAQGMTTP
jgi:molybdate transport system substrate-binding protein